MNQKNFDALLSLLKDSDDVTFEAIAASLTMDAKIIYLYG